MARMAPPPPLAIGVDIGGTKVAAGVVDDDGRILDRWQEPTPSRSPQAAEDAIVRAVERLRQRHQVEAVGIGAAGWVDNDQAVVRFSPHLAWRSEPLKARLSGRIELPLIVDNDANAAAWAEYRFGAGRGSSVMVCITLGTGIGGGLVIGGRLFRGSYGMAGEWGHMISVPHGHWCECGNRGCWEQYASGNALVRDASELVRAGSPLAHRLDEMVGGDVTALTGPLVTEAAREGDPLAVQLIGEIGAWLGVGLAGMAAAFDPGCIIVGGGVSEAGELLLAPARAEFSRTLTGRGHRIEPPIVAAELGPDAGFIGAADMARSAARRSRRMRRRRRERPLRRRRSVLPDV